ncbi:MAG TPA: hypothetical protein VL501_02370 [Pyrinomonadaceae bacterium]|nr:hypothetical protein [Pyrinomonadaceae bacterium]
MTGENKAQESDETGSENGSVDIRESESGQDTGAGHTPGKAEGDDDPAEYSH